MLVVDPEAIREELEQFQPQRDDYAPLFVERLLAAAAEARASDIHLQPSESTFNVAWRRNGVLEPIGEFPAEASQRVVARLKVLAGLLTYEQQLPQEGRLRESVGGVQMRVSVFPTVWGERAVVRLFSSPDQLCYLDQLGFSLDDRSSWEQALSDRHGLVMITGPAGSGKTTTAYALMRELVRRHGGSVSLMSIEDPVEARLEGVAQSQVHDGSGFTLETGLRSLLRQDPEIVLVGEIRDPTTAQLVFRAALTGHLVITTFHAGSSAEAIRRLIDMGIEPYMLKSGLRALFHQQLLRMLCDDCSRWEEELPVDVGLGVERERVPVGCQACRNSGYRGRFPITEWFPLRSIRRSETDLLRVDAKELECRAKEEKIADRWQAARAAVASGRTTGSEVRRVMGWE